MVIVRLLGGLGNQFFQYAAGRSVASLHQVALKLDISNFDRFPGREYKLHHYNIAAEVASALEVGELTGKYRNNLFRIMGNSWQWFIPYYRRSVFEQRGHNYDANIRRTPHHFYMVGYWQSEKYFEDIENKIRLELTLREALDSENEILCEQIESTDSVSLHVRRGDYVSNPVANQHHGLCSLDYYNTAINRMSEIVKDPHFFIFSDDMDWVQDNLVLDYDKTFVQHNGVDKDFEDMRLMRHCKHHIIANSSFSWWGAWLSDSEEKIVIAPKKWFSGPIDTQDIIPGSWLRL